MNGCRSAVNKPTPHRVLSPAAVGAYSEVATEIMVANETCVGNGTSAETSRCERSKFKDQPK